MKPGTLRLGWPQWAFVMVTVLLVIPVVVALVVPNEVGAGLIRRFELPGFQTSLGFKSAWVRLPATSGCDVPVFSITEVVKGSAFDLAGVRPGDIPSIAYSGGEHGFLWGLVWGRARGYVKLYLTSFEEASRGAWTNPRAVTVTFPGRTAKPPA